MVMDGLKNLLNPQTPEQRTKALEVQAARLEAKAVSAEQDAALRKRITSANTRIKAVSPPRRTMLQAVLGLGGLIIIILLVSSMCSKA